MTDIAAVCKSYTHRKDSMTGSYMHIMTVQIKSAQASSGVCAGRMLEVGRSRGTLMAQRGVVGDASPP